MFQITLLGYVRAFQRVPTLSSSTTSDSFGPGEVGRTPRGSPPDAKSLPTSPSDEETQVRTEPERNAK